VLVLDELTADQARGLGPETPEARDNAVLSRWLRAHELGARPSGETYPDGETGSALDLRRERLADVFREENALLTPIAGQLAARGLVAIVADPDGVILSSHGGGTFIDPAARVRLVCGARWSEDARGTNAIGTAIAEARPVAVLGSAHFEERNHGLFCYATPVRDAYGDLIAVLDVTGPMIAHDPAVGVAVQAAGAGLERALRAISYAQAGSSVLRSIERLIMCSGTPAFLAEPQGALRIVNDAARAELGVTHQTSLTCERVFGASYTDLVRLALDGKGTRFESGGRVFDVELDPIFGAQGRALAVTIHLFPRTPVRPLGRLSRPRSEPPPSASMAVAQPTPISTPVISTPVSTRGGQPMSPAFEEIASADPEVDRAKSDAARFASTALPLLLLAETGTGKELFARAVHRASPSARGPFIPVNCGAFTPSLLESELFGYAPGAFTGASRTGAEGKLSAAHGGTLFLDEVAEMPDALQAALLRVLEDGTFTPVGDARSRKVSFRLICATCRDLPGLVSAGKFRQDLFYRIYGACVKIPPLRDRADRLWLAQTLLSRIAPGKALATDAAHFIEEHDWPGNVRELKSALAHAVALSGPRTLLAHEDFPRPLLPSPRSTPKVGATGGSRKEVLEAAFRQALDACDGNVSRAAEKLGVARSTLYRAGFPAGQRPRGR
jgi:transcriptional regulator of acetoin/glycerol metabolism